MRVFLGLVFGIIIGSQSGDIRYGKFKFTTTDNNLYQTKINGQKIDYNETDIKSFKEEFEIYKEIISKI